MNARLAIGFAAANVPFDMVAKAFWMFKWE